MRPAVYIRPARYTVFGPRAPAMRVSVMRAALRTQIVQRHTANAYIPPVSHYDGVFYWGLLGTRGHR